MTQQTVASKPVPRRKPSHRAAIPRMQLKPLFHASESQLERQAVEFAKASRPLARFAAIQHRGETSSGSPAKQERSRFDTPFGYDLSRIRIHTDARAEAMTDDLHARAFTYGRNIYFGRGEYNPHSVTGRELIAHELTHAVQQSHASIGARIQCACTPLSPPFDLAASSIGSAIHSELSGVTIQIPNRDPEQPPIRRPVVNPDQVITLLSSSPCFLRDARQVERTYCSGQSGCGSRLDLEFHRDPTRGSEFSPGRPGQPPTLRIEVTTLSDVIRGIVHEIGHAVPAGRARRGWPRAIARGWGRGGGAVTQAVRRRLREESSTRSRENEVMQEIQDSQVWRQLVGGTPRAASLTQPGEVRSSFVSGRPKLTYQENFIIEEMKGRYRSALRGNDEALARRAARGMVSEGFSPPRVSSLNSFTTTAQTLTSHRTRLSQPIPLRPPPTDAARKCIEIYNQHQRDLGNAQADLRQTHSRCPAFIRLFQRHLRIPFSVRNDRGRQRVEDLRNTMRDRYLRTMSARRTSGHLINWYDQWHSSLSGQDRSNRPLQRSVLRYFSWVLIAEAMSSEWSPHATADPQIHTQHLQMLIAAAGSGSRTPGTLSGQRWLLSGIQMPPTGGGTP